MESEEKFVSRFEKAVRLYLPRGQEYSNNEQLRYFAEHLYNKLQKRRLKRLSDKEMEVLVQPFGIGIAFGVYKTRCDSRLEPLVVNNPGAGWEWRKKNLIWQLEQDM